MTKEHLIYAMVMFGSWALGHSVAANWRNEMPKALYWLLFASLTWGLLAADKIANRTTIIHVHYDKKDNAR